ncbi:MAG: hypothetical protein WC915_06705 [archaeon]
MGIAGSFFKSNKKKMMNIKKKILEIKLIDEKNLFSKKKVS